MHTFLSYLNEQSTSSAAISPTGSPLNTVGQIVSVVFVLFFTIALIYFFAYISRKLKYGTGSFTNKNINVIEYKHIGNNNNLVLASVGEKYVLLGSSKDKVSFLCEIDKEELNLEVVENENISLSFKNILNSKIKNEPKDENGGK